MLEKEKEVKKILEILSHADKGCEYCCVDLFEEFIKKFPKNKKQAEDFFEKKFKISIKNFKGNKNARRI